MPRILAKRMRDLSLHERVLEGLEATEPALYEELTTLRRQNPQAYRKRMRKLIRAGAEPSDFTRYEPLPINSEHTPGDASRGRDPSLMERLAEARSDARAHAAGRAETARKVAEAEERQEAHRKNHAARQAENTGKSPKQVQREAVDPGSAADLSILDDTIGALKKALASGSLDGILDELLAAEHAGAARKGALKAIKERQG